MKENNTIFNSLTRDTETHPTAENVSPAQTIETEKPQYPRKIIAW